MSILGLTDISEPSKCIQCGASVSRTAKFCGECGATQAAAPSPEQQHAAEVPTFGSVQTSTTAWKQRVLWGVLIGGVVLTLAAAVLSGNSWRTVAPPPAPSQAAAPAMPEVNNWSVTTPDVNRMDGIATQFINSEDRGVYLHLCFQSKGACDVPIAVQAPRNCFIESNVYHEYSSHLRSVRVKFDDGKPQVQVWGITDDHNAINPRGSQAAFIDQLKKHKKFSIELGCASDDSDVVTLDIAGLPEAMAKLSVKH